MSTSKARGADQRLIAMIDKTHSCQLRVSLSSWRDKHKIELADFTSVIPGIYFQAGPGISLDVEKLSELLKAILIAERAVRGFTVGRRNWLFSGTFAAAQRSALILSIVETCKANGVDAEAYMADVMERIQNDWPASRLDELMPWNWTPLSDSTMPIAA